MSGEFAPQRIIGNLANGVRTAALAASAQRPSTDLRVILEARQGGGRVELLGPYTGASDTAVEVEIIAGSGTELRPSVPVLSGVGSGTLDVLGLAVGAVPESLSVRLVSAGTPDVAAELPFFGCTLIAQATGPDGNLLALEVTRNLTLAATDYATLSEIAPGTVDFEGPQWDWGAVPTVDQQIPATAPRLAFEGHPQVHRHWRTWEGDRWVCHLDPAPASTVAANTRVLAVSGDYAITLSDGTTSEVYSAVTAFEFLREIAARSGLVTVDGVVAEDRAPGGMAATDIPLRTDAFALAVEAQITSTYGVKRLDAITVEPDAPTETITIERQPTGRWSVSGVVSGDLGEALAGVPYSGSVVGFTIPAALLPDGASGEITHKVGLQARDPAEVIPAICVYPVLGAAATPKSVTFTYGRRPPKTCDCSDLLAPIPSASCLGLEGIDMADLPAAQQTRLQTLLAWRADRIAANVAMGPTKPAAQSDMDLIDDVARAFAGALADVVSVVAPETALTAWDAALTAMQAELVLFDNTYAQKITEVAPGQVLQMPADLPEVVGAADDPMQVGAHLFCPSNAHTYLITSITGVSSTALAAALFTIFPPNPPTNGSTTTGAFFSGAGTTVSGTITYQDVGLMKDVDAGLARQLVRKYAAQMDEVKIIAGIAPAFNSASSGAGACWQDDPEAAYWWADLSGEYLPAFTDRAYVSARLVNGEVVGTMEFGFGMAVACIESLKEGDAITIVVNGESLDGYSGGDRYLLPVVAAAAAAFGGGATGDATHTWAVRGSVSGTLPDWLWEPSAPLSYTDGPADLAMTQGGIPYLVGDTWSLTVEGGVLRWRRDGGLWSEEDLFGAPPDLGDGLTLAVSQGAAPSFVTGDAYAFSALSTYGPDRLRQPREGRAWSWGEDAATLTVDLGAVQSIEALLIALHTVPLGGGITIEGGEEEGVYLWSVTPAWSAGPILTFTEPETEARYLRLSLTGCGAGGASIGWLWAGVPWAPTAGCSAMTRVRRYSITRTQGRNQVGLYRGRGMGGRWTWSLNAGAALTGPNADELLALLDHVMEQGIEPVCLVPELAAPPSAMLAQIDADEVALVDELGFALDGLGLVSVDLPFRGLAA